MRLVRACLCCGLDLEPYHMACPVCQRLVDPGQKQMFPSQQKQIKEEWEYLNRPSTYHPTKEQLNRDLGDLYEGRAHGD